MWSANRAWGCSPAPETKAITVLWPVDIKFIMRWMSTLLLKNASFNFKVENFINCVRSYCSLRPKFGDTPLWKTQGSAPFCCWMHGAYLSNNAAAHIRASVILTGLRMSPSFRSSEYDAHKLLTNRSYARIGTNSPNEVGWGGPSGAGTGTRPNEGLYLVRWLFVLLWLILWRKASSWY